MENKDTKIIKVARRIRATVLNLLKKFFDFFFNDKQNDNYIEWLRNFRKSRKWGRMSDEQHWFFANRLINEMEKREVEKREEQNRLAREKYIPVSNEIRAYYETRPNSQKKYIRLLDRLYQEVGDLSFSECSSIFKDTINKTREDDEYGETRYDKLSCFDLEFHTLGVFREAIRLTKEKTDLFSNKVVILAIAHDFGKCPSIRKILGILENKKIPHNVISAMYVKKICTEMGMIDDGEFFNEMLANHHTKETKTQKKTLIDYEREKEAKNYLKNIFIKTLNIADQNQREREFEILNEKNAIKLKPKDKIETKDKTETIYEKTMQRFEEEAMEEFQTGGKRW